jgi:cutinase
LRRGGDDLGGVAVPTASAAPCPDVEVAFARGTAEPPGVGGVGQAFIGSSRSQVGSRSLGVDAVNYPADEDFAPSASAGAGDAHAHVQSMVANCPNTKLLLGGYSQGAMVIDLITIAQAPNRGSDPPGTDGGRGGPCCRARPVGNPSDRYLGAPVSVVSPWYGAKAIDLCAPGDSVCTPGAPLALPSHDELFSAAHLSYQGSGMPGQGATFVVGRL